MGEYMAAQMDRQIEGAISENERLANENERLRKASRIALDALEAHAKQYPHMQKGYTVDAIGLLRRVLTPNP